MKRWFLPAAARARGQSNDLDREILASNLFNCCKEVINAPPVPSVSRCIHIVYRHKNIWEYQWSNFIYNCMSTFLHYVRCKDALLDCSAPGGERCESLTGVDEIRKSIGMKTDPLQWLCDGLVPTCHQCITITIMSLQTRSCYGDLVFIDSTGGCHHDNLQHPSKWQSCHYDNSKFSSELNYDG